MLAPVAAKRTAGVEQFYYVSHAL